MMAKFDKNVLKQSYSIKSKIESFFTGIKIEISRDAKYIFSPCFDVLKILDVSNGQVVKQITSEIDDNIITFGLSDDSKTVVIAHESGLLKQWFWSEDRLERTWKSIHSGPIALIVFDPTNTLVATAGTDSTIKVWQIVRNYCTHNLRGAKGVFSSVVFSPNHSEEKYLIYGSADDYSVHVWNLITSERVTQLSGHCSKVTAIVFTIDRQFILTGSRDKLVIVWNASTHQKVRSIPIYESIESIQVIESEKVSFINSVSKDKIFITAGEKGILRIWNYESGDLLHTQNNPLMPSKQLSDQQNDATINSQLITQIIYCKEISELAVISYEKNIIFYKIEDLSLVRQFVGNNDDVLDIKLLGKNESHIAVATNSSDIKVFEIMTSNCYLLKGHTDIVVSLDTFANDAYTLISSSKDNTVRVWKFSTCFSSGICYYYGSGHTHSVTAISTPHFQTNFFVSGSEDTTLKVWQLPKSESTVTGVPLTAKLTQRAHEKTINSIAISPNDQLIASGSQDKTAKIWSVNNLDLLGVIRGHRKGIWCLEFSPVDQVLVTSSADATIKIWALNDYTCLKTFQGHDCSVLKVMFIDRGMQLISSASDGNINIWNLKSNESIKTIDAHNDKIWALTKSNDENILISGGSDSLIVFWKNTTNEEIEEIAIKQEVEVRSSQTLLNLMQKKKWSKALKLAIRLDHPFRALSIIKETLIETNGLNEINNVLLDLREDQLLALLEYALVWNTNSKHYIASQCVLKAVFHKIPSKQLLKTPDLKQKIEKLIPFNERHINRLTRLERYVTFVDFVWDKIKLPEVNSTQFKLPEVNSTQFKLPEVKSTQLNHEMSHIHIDCQNVEHISGSDYIYDSDNNID